MQNEFIIFIWSDIHRAGEKRSQVMSPLFLRGMYNIINKALYDHNLLENNITRTDIMETFIVYWRDI